MAVIAARPSRLKSKARGFVTKARAFQTVNSLRRRYGLAPNRATKSIRSRPIARTSHFYDVLNELTLDLQFDHYKSCEQALAFKHLKFLPKQASAIVLMDRGYRDSTLWGALNDHGANILVRLVKTSSMVKELKRVNFKR